MGHIDGQPGSRVFFAVSGGFLHATLEDSARRTHVGPVATRELSQFYTVDPERVPPCVGERRTYVDGAVLADGRGPASARRGDRSGGGFDASP